MTLSKQEQVEARARAIHLRRVRGGKRGYKRWLKDSLKDDRNKRREALQAITAPDGKRYNISSIGLNAEACRCLAEVAKKQAITTGEPVWFVLDRLTIEKRQQIAMQMALVASEAR